MPFYRAPDGTTYHLKMGDRRTQAPKPCADKRIDGTRCGQISGYLCDWPVNEAGDLCNKPICEQHAHVIGNDQHCCDVHHDDWLATQLDLREQ